MLLCESFSTFSGWQCQRAPDGSLYISTPVLLHDGTPLGFFLEQHGSITRFSDEGLTIFAMRNMGVDMTDRRNWKGLANVVERLGFQIAEDGEIVMDFPTQHSAIWFSNITRLMGGIADWQQERFDLNDTQFNLTRDVEALLKAKDPGRKLDINVTATIDGHSFKFDFLWGDTYIDAIPPSARSTGPRLRKAIMARPLELHGGHILVIVDDRRKPTKAKEEIAVLSQVVNTKSYTAFENSPIYH
ncbi:DUF1828 domain-containing protein [Vreelandella venusta]|uniref:DUF1828 domain-containing protein n=1 Tax=Vreelandella venusta TaxID=44935 RepID=UPI003F663476